MVIKRINILITFLLITQVFWAQDIHFSQFYAFSQMLNPAQMGDHEGSGRIEAIHRNQWKQINNNPLTTTGVAFDKAFHYYSHEIDGGIVMARDQFSGFNTICNKIFLTAAYGTKKFGSDWRIGVQTGLVTNSTNLAIQTFPNQWNYPKGEFDVTVPNGEDNIRGSQMYMDFNAGLTWSKKFKKSKASSGIAFNHLNRPKDTYFNQLAERRKVRGIFHFSYEQYIDDNWVLEPKLFLMWTARANDLLMGTNVRYKTGANGITALQAGCYYRHGVNRNMDALYPVVGFSLKAFDVGFSYDINISDLKTGIKRPTSYEISLIYTLPSNKVKYKIIPCDRY